jgi:hypothetical protein
MLLSTTSTPQWCLAGTTSTHEHPERVSTAGESGEFPKLDDEYPSMHPLVHLVSFLVSDKPW